MFFPVHDACTHGVSDRSMGMKDVDSPSQHHPMVMLIECAFSMDAANAWAFFLATTGC